MKELFEVMARLEDSGYRLDCDCYWLDIYSTNGKWLGVEPILYNDEDSYCYDDFFTPDFAGNNTTEMNFNFVNDIKDITLIKPNATELYNTIVEWLK